MIWLSAILGSLGIAGMVIGKSLLKILIGMQLLILGASVLLVYSGIVTQVPVQGHVFGFFIILGGIAQLVTGFTLSMRVFIFKHRYLK
jgi:NADH:ubiquinone oxidoreductase subunit K